MSITTVFKRGAFIAAGAVALLGAAPASAWHDSTTTGSAVYTSNSDKTLNVDDTEPDSRSAYGEFTRQGISGTSRLTNGGGYGSTLSRTYAETILSVRACVDVQLAPDYCGSWG